MTLWGGYLTAFNHAASVYGLQLLFNGRYEDKTIVRILIEMVVLYRCIGVSVTMGAHRYWSHRSFEASKLVQIGLMLLQTMSFQGSIFWWARDHRSHHKHTNTHADPYNAKRGMFYAHIGWVFAPKHKDVAKHPVPALDLEQDPIVQFQKRYYILLAPIMCYGVPAIYSHLVYNDALLGFFVLGCVRWVVTSHSTWMVNSLAHSGEEGDGTVDHWLVSLFACGEGYHKWHHTYPTDAFGSPRTVEAYVLNVTGVLIVLLEKMGLVSNMKKVPLQSLVNNTMQRALPSLSKVKYSIHFTSPKGTQANPLSTLRMILWEAPDTVEGVQRAKKRGLMIVEGDMNRFMDDLVASDNMRKKMPLFERVQLSMDLWLLPRQQVETTATKYESR